MRRARTSKHLSEDGAPSRQDGAPTRQSQRKDPMLPQMTAEDASGVSQFQQGHGWSPSRASLQRDRFLYRGGPTPSKSFFVPTWHPDTDPHVETVSYYDSLEAIEAFGEVDAGFVPLPAFVSDKEYLPAVTGADNFEAASPAPVATAPGLGVAAAAVTSNPEEQPQEPQHERIEYGTSEWKALLGQKTLKELEADRLWLQQSLCARISHLQRQKNSLQLARAAMLG
ncbi:unnamed protein product [Chrysoparadoxa australica]